METNNLEGTLVTQQFLEQVVSGVKPLLNPQSVSSELPVQVVKVTLNQYLTNFTYPLYITANGLSTTGDTHVQFSGHLVLGDSVQLVGLNSGRTKIARIAYSNETPMCLYFITENFINSLSVEIISSAYKENLVALIEAVDTEDVDAYLESENATSIDVVEDASFDGYNFAVIDKNGNEIKVPASYTGQISQYISSINEAGTAALATQAQSLTESVNITVTSPDDSLVTMTGSGVINSDLSSSTLTIKATSINLPEQEIPLASTSTRGGVKLYGSEDPGYNNFPVQLSNEKAYVHVPLGDMDIHRYQNLAAVPNPKVGDIVQYIGNTTSQYTNGYFYQYWPTSFTVDPIPNDSTWYSLTGIADIIKAYNTTINYSLVPGIGINISLVDESDSDASEGEALFVVSQGSYTIDMTYEEIQQNLGIQLKNGYTVWDASDLIVYWRVAEGSTGIWIQKNVQPLIQMQSALVYKGVCTWNELQQKTSIAQPGDFYTITDKFDQEYFFTGTDWEFMGDVFTVNGSLSIKTKSGSSSPVTVSTFKANDSGDQPIIFKEGQNITLTPDPTNKTITITAATEAVPVGTITMYAGEEAPDGWLLCNGDLLPATVTIGIEPSTYDFVIRYRPNPQSQWSYRYYKMQDSEYVNLGSSLGIIYGMSDNGIYLPNLQQRFPLGAQANGTIGRNGHTSSSTGWPTDLGKIGGESTTTLSAAESGLPAHGHDLSYDLGQTDASGARPYSFNTTNGGENTHLTASNNTSQDASLAHNNVPEFLAVNFIVKY